MDLYYLYLVQNNVRSRLTGQSPRPVTVSTGLGKAAPYCHTAILPYCHTAILSYYHTVILSYCHTAILPYCHTVILSYCHTAILKADRSEPPSCYCQHWLRLTVNKLHYLGILPHLIMSLLQCPGNRCDQPRPSGPARVTLFSTIKKTMD